MGWYRSEWKRGIQWCFLEKAKQRYWQILPLNPTDTACDSSPYHSISAFALNPLLISPDLLVQDHYLKRSETENFPGPSSSRVLYEEATRWKNELQDKAFRRFHEREEPYEYKTFCMQNSWLEDYALFRALKNHFNMAPWGDCPVNLKP